MRWLCSLCALTPLLVRILYLAVIIYSVTALRILHRTHLDDLLKPAKHFPPACVRLFPLLYISGYFGCLCCNHSIWPPLAPATSGMTIFCSKYNPGPFYCASCKLDCFLTLCYWRIICPFLLAVSPFSSSWHFVALSLMCPSFCLLSLSLTSWWISSAFCESRVCNIFSFLRFSVPFAFVQNTIIKFQHLWRRRKINTPRKYLFIISSLSLIFESWSLEFSLSASSFALIFVVNNYRRQKFALSSQALGFHHLNKLPIRIRLLFLLRSGVIFPLRPPTLCCTKYKRL